MSLGVEVLASLAAAKAARRVIAQVNHRMPRVLGDAFLHVSRVHAVVECDEPLPEFSCGTFGDVEQRIGRHIADLTPDGATLQLGIGAIPDAVLASLTGKRDLGIHTEMISDGVMQAMEAGIVTGEKKTLHPGKAIATLILGSPKLYRFVDNNPAFELHPSSYTNDPFIIAQNDNLIAINSALEVDLTGQVCADSIGTMIYSGFGGQLDFIRGAARSRGGKPIIALPATARGEEFSRIVPILKPGAGVVTTRGDVHYVVTECGVAELYGKTLRQRARALIDLAHPRFRAELERAAWERHLL
jgi:acyl-CoA hydrolase